MQRVLHSNGYGVTEGQNGAHLVVLKVNAGDMSPDQARAQLETVGEVASELVPLLSALVGGVELEELAEVATELPALHSIPAPVRQAAIELASQLRAASSDGQLTGMEVLQSLLGAARHAAGF